MTPPQVERDELATTLRLAYPMTYSTGWTWEEVADGILKREASQQKEIERLRSALERVAAPETCSCFECGNIARSALTSPPDAGREA